MRGSDGLFDYQRQIIADLNTRKGKMALTEGHDVGKAYGTLQVGNQVIAVLDGTPMYYTEPVCPDCKGTKVIKLFNSEVPCDCVSDSNIRFAGQKMIAADMHAVEIKVADAMAQNMYKSARYAPTKPMNYARQMKKLHELNPQFTIQDVALRLLCSPQFVMGRLAIAKLPPSYDDPVNEGRITPTIAAMIGTLPASEHEKWLAVAEVSSAAELAPKIFAWKKANRNPQNVAKLAGMDYQARNRMYRVPVMPVVTSIDSIVYDDEVMAKLAEKKHMASQAEFYNETLGVAHDTTEDSDRAGQKHPRQINLTLHCGKLVSSGLTNMTGFTHLERNMLFAALASLLEPFEVDNERNECLSPTGSSKPLETMSLSTAQQKVVDWKPAL